MAPETLIKNAKFTEKSDVWSYGVTLWEIFSKTQRSPYFQYLENEVVSIKKCRKCAQSKGYYCNFTIINLISKKNHKLSECKFAIPVRLKQIIFT